MTTTANTNAQTVRAFTKIFKNEHNVEGVNHLFHPEFQHNFGPDRSPGLEGFKEIGRIMNGSFPDVVVTEEDLIVTENRVVERSSAAATHKGAQLGVPPTGRRVAWREIHIYELKDGLIAQHWVEWSQLELLTAIGAL